MLTKPNEGKGDDERRGREKEGGGEGREEEGGQVEVMERKARR